MNADLTRALEVARLAVDEASAAGIEVSNVTSSPVLGVSIYALDSGLAPALAMILGLSRRHVHRACEFFDGRIGGVDVSTHHEIPEQVAS